MKNSQKGKTLNFKQVTFYKTNGFNKYKKKTFNISYLTIENMLPHPCGSR